MQEIKMKYWSLSDFPDEFPDPTQSDPWQADYAGDSVSVRDHNT